jgi:tetratricopeptide (TPR) repeat protein
MTTTSGLTRVAHGSRTRKCERPLIHAETGTRQIAERGDQHSEQSKLRQQLKAEPHHHWILTRLSSVYYEQRRYALALKYAEKAFAEEPSCPLVLWDYAGALQMLGRHNEALDLYARIVTRGVIRLANGECGEGKAWARGVVSDSHYRASLSLKAIGNERASLSALEQCLELRGPGCRSIYRLNELRTSDVTSTRPNRALQPSSRPRKKAKAKGRFRAPRG